MSVYVDNFNVKADVPNGARTVRGVWSHMTADTRAELDAMADAIGMKRSWIQYPGTWKEHYDVTLSKKKLAIANGAIEVDSMTVAREARDRATAARAVFDGEAHDYVRDVGGPYCKTCGEPHHRGGAS